MSINTLSDADPAGHRPHFRCNTQMNIEMVQDEGRSRVERKSLPVAFLSEGASDFCHGGEVAVGQRRDVRGASSVWHVPRQPPGNTREGC